MSGKRVTTDFASELLQWVKKEFRSSRGGRKVYPFSGEVVLPTEEVATHAFVLDISSLEGLKLSRATHIFFSRSEGDPRTVCNYEITLTSEDGSQIDLVTQGVTTMLGEKKSTQFSNASIDDDEWKYLAALGEIESVSRAVMAAQGALVKMPHPMFPAAIRSVHVKL